MIVALCSTKWVSLNIVARMWQKNYSIESEKRGPKHKLHNPWRASIKNVKPNSERTESAHNRKKYRRLPKDV